MTLTFLHVQGHQDTKANQPLMVEEQLNIDCDHHAKEYVLLTDQSSVAFGNPDIPNARPHIRISSKLICQQLLPTVHHALAAPAYNWYLKRKLNWTQQELWDVNWLALNTALDSLTPNDHRCILLFINDKLPLHALKAHPHMGSPMCPSCMQENKDMWHFLECTQPNQTKLFVDLKATMTKTVQKLQIHPCILTFIWLGLMMIRHNTTYPDISLKVPEPLPAPNQESDQAGLGSTIYQGRTSWMWASAIDALHPPLPLNGTQIMVKFQKLIWQYILNLWKLHNAHLHQNASMMDLPNYHQVVTVLYNQQHQLPPAAQSALFRQLLKTLLEQPTP